MKPHLDWRCSGHLHLILDTSNNPTDNFVKVQAHMDQPGGWRHRLWGGLGEVPRPLTAHNKASYTGRAGCSGRRCKRRTQVDGHDTWSPCGLTSVIMNTACCWLPYTSYTRGSLVNPHQIHRAETPWPGMLYVQEWRPKHPCDYKEGFRPSFYFYFLTTQQWLKFLLGPT